MQIRYIPMIHRVALQLLGILLMCTVTTYAQKNISRIQGSINLDSRYMLQVQKLTHQESADDDAIELPLDNKGHFYFETQINAPTWYRLTFMPTKRDQQLGASFPFLLLPGTREQLHLHYADSTYLSVADKGCSTSNLALIRYSAFTNSRMRASFLSPPAPSAYKDFAQAYIDQANQDLGKYNIKDTVVRNYLQTWSYINYATMLFQGQQSYKTTDFPADLLHVLDRLNTLSFYNGSILVDNYLQLLSGSLPDLTPLDALESQFETIQKYVKTPELRDDIMRMKGDSFVRNYKIKDNTAFEKDNQRLGKILSEIQDRTTVMGLIKDFNNLHYTQPGSSLPDVVFEDINGSQVSLKDFKGKYIYIDLWASWCVPCIQEIPHLKSLEHTFQDKDIVFISISLDADKGDWLTKVKDLNLEGRQWHLAQSEYDNLMNVQGIPHFILYSPDGKLLQYKAPRPSSDSIQKLLESIL